MEEVELGWEEDDLACSGPCEPGAGVVKGCGGVLDSAVVGWRRDYQFAGLLLN